ncbi:hypothetical protein C0Q70_18773 [Pomacea canaliculata]|uniref:Uncharacterized protein n=1 Tax=Pomacea canaliculata TaxID=400727 RepID=A0A2T7NHI4_POMCA|nr:hypothetical protein C0Q70_18773 [Pomacea canaliculata]
MDQCIHVYLVAVQPNADSQRVGLSGQYKLKINADGMTLLTSPPNMSPVSLGRRPPTAARGQRSQSLRRSAGSPPPSFEEEASLEDFDESSAVEVLSWRLSMLKRFNVEKEGSAGQLAFLVIECGPNSPTGEGTFRFSSKDAAAILRSIRRFISIAMATKQRMLRSSGEVRVRTESTTASYQHILDRSGRPRTGSEEGRERADETPRAVLNRSVSSSSSSSTLPMPGSPCPDTSEEGAAADDDDDSAPLVTTATPITTTQRKSSASSGNDPHNETNDWQQQHELVWNKRRRAGMPRNSSVPNVVTLATDGTGYIIIDRDVGRMRTSSMTVERPRNSMSVSSGDSGVMVGGDEIVRRFDVSGRQSAGEPRVGSNSFDSAVSMDSFSARKVSDVDVGETIQESPCLPSLPSLLSEDKITPTGSSSHIYQDIDNLGRSIRRRESAGVGQERRRHSTGEVHKENEYEELETLRKGVGSTASVITMGDKPPELPARPASLLTLGKSRRKQGVISTALSFFSSQLASGRSVPAETSLTKKGDLRSSTGSIDPYTSISEDDLEVRLARRRRSSDVTPYGSLREQHHGKSPQVTSRSAPATPADTLPAGDIAFTTDETTQAGQSGTCQKDLLSFSDTDLSQDSRGRDAGQDAQSSTKALLDFFLDDLSFHSNPMVTGELVTGIPSAAMVGSTAEVSSERGMAIPPRGWSQQHGWSAPSSFQAMGPAGWAHFAADFGGHSPLSSSPATQTGWSTATYPPSTAVWHPYLPYPPNSSMASMAPLMTSTPMAPDLTFLTSTLMAPNLAAKDSGISARVAGVYIDMSSDGKVDDDRLVIVDDYVKPDEANDHEDSLDFLLFQ